LLTVIFLVISQTEYPWITPLGVKLRVAGWSIILRKERELKSEGTAKEKISPAVDREMVGN
jgi:hypothetical protein